MPGKPKPADFQFELPTRAEKLAVAELSPAMQQSLEVTENLSDRRIYRYSVIIQRQPDRPVKNKYRWQQLKGVIFGLELYTPACSLVGGLFPRKDVRDWEIGVELGTGPDLGRLITAKIATQIQRSIPGKYWGVYAQRTDRAALWLLKRRWIDQHDLQNFSVVVQVPPGAAPLAMRCKICGYRANAETVQTQSRTVLL